MGDVPPFLALMKTCAIIPALNAAGTIGKVVKEIKELGIDPIVIDDGSNDQTSKVSRENGAIVLKNEVNSGKGASLREGIARALSERYDRIFTLDADGQHSPGDIPNFLSLLNTKPQADMIIGNRMNSPAGMPLIRKLTNRFMSRVLSGICGQKIPDTQNGFRLIKSSLLENIELKSRRFEIESELIIKAAAKRALIISVPITSIYQNRQSRINPIADTFRFVKFIISYIICKGK